MILSVTLNPSVDHALFVENVCLGDTNRVLRTETDAGGKGVNLSRVLCELGGRSVATGFLGGGAGAYVAKALDLQGVPHSFVEVAGETRTNISIEDAERNPPTTFNERGPQITEADFSVLLTRIESYLPEITWLSMGGSLPPGVNPDAFQKLVEMAHTAGIRCLVDADGEPMRLAAEARPHFIKPNRREAARLLGRPVETDAEAKQAVLELYERIGADDRIAIVSLGEAGAIMACADGVFHAATPEVETKSTVGCGDSLLGGMLWGLSTGLSNEEAFRWGIAAGAATAATDGTQIARRAKVQKLFARVAVARV